MSGSVVVPLFDEHGRIENLYGRKVTRNLRAGTPLHTWLDDSRTGLLNRAAFTAASTLIVTASIIDALVVWSHGHRNVTAIHGLESPTQELLAAIEGNTKKLILLFRRDTHGDQVAEKIATLVSTLDISVFRALLPSSMDVSDLVTSVANPQQAITQVIRSAEWMAGISLPTTTTSTTSWSPSSMEKGPVVSPGGSSEASASLETTSASSTQNGASTSNHAAKNDEVVVSFEDRRWRVRGLARTTPEAMKVNVMVSLRGAFHVDVIELYAARQRAMFVKVAAEEIAIDEETIKRDLGHVLLRLEEAQDELLQADEPQAKNVELTEVEREAALGLLRDPQLLDRILSDFTEVGVVGERTNLLLGYLAALSRKLEQPLAVVIQSSSAAGKSSLMEAILSFIPEEDRLSYSAMTAQSIYYMGATDLRHRVLSFAEEEGVGQASYPLKLLQSEGELTIASTGKDPTTGRLISHEYKVEGPTAIMMTTTKIDIDEELLSRCLVLSVDERPEQTKAIQQHQRWELSLDGQLGRQRRDEIQRLHQNAQRLLRPILVVIPADIELAYADHRVRARRDHPKLLGLIEAIVLLHQHQREVKTFEVEGRVIEYIEARTADIELAVKLMGEIGGLGVGDLPPQTRRVLSLLDGFVAEKAKEIPRGLVRFTRREVRETLGLGDTQLWTHLRRLVQAEYLVVHPSGHGRGIVYELAFDATTHDDPSDSGQIRPKFGPNSRVVRSGQIASKSGKDQEDLPEGDGDLGSARPGASARSRTAVVSGDD